MIESVTLTVIIPTYNRLRLIGYTLDSLNPQLHPGVEMEIIVVDDGSTDGTTEAIKKKYPDIKVLKNIGRGAPYARNTGLAEAKGKYILYLDSDDLVGRNYFIDKISYLDRNPQVNAVYGDYLFFSSEHEFNENSIIFKHKYPLITSSSKAKEHLVNFLSGNFIPPAAIIWQRNFLLKCNGHDIDLSINQDVDLFIRAIFMGLKIVTVQDNSNAYIRNHNVDNRVGDPKNESNKWIQILELRKKIFANLSTFGYDDDESRQALSNFLFNYWKLLRHNLPVIAEQYLSTAKKIYWPINVKGKAAYVMLSKLIGPENAAKLKYFFLKRD